MAGSLVSEFGRWTYPAGATNLVQFQFVTVNAAGQIVMPSAGNLCVVLDDAPAPGALGVAGPTIVGTIYTVVFTGIMKVIAGGTLAPFVPVTTDSSGHAVTAVGAAQSSSVMGFTMTSCSSGDIVPINLTYAGLHF